MTQLLTDDPECIRRLLLKLAGITDGARYPARHHQRAYRNRHGEQTYGDAHHQFDKGHPFLGMSGL